MNQAQVDQHYPIEIPGGRIYTPDGAEVMLRAMWSALGTFEFLRLVSGVFDWQTCECYNRADAAVFPDSRDSWARSAKIMNGVTNRILSAASDYESDKL
jgi:hypothetical protein